MKAASNLHYDCLKKQHEREVLEQQTAFFLKNGGSITVEETFGVKAKEVSGLKHFETTRKLEIDRKGDMVTLREFAKMAGFTMGTMSKHKGRVLHFPKVAEISGNAHYFYKADCIEYIDGLKSRKSDNKFNRGETL